MTRPMRQSRVSASISKPKKTETKRKVGKDMIIKRWKYTRFWAVYDAADTLVCVCVYKRGAKALITRLEGR